MKKFPIILSLSSKQELKNIWNYTFEKSCDSEIADEVITKLTNFIYNQLPYFPEMGVKKDNIHKGLRFFPIKSYGIYYYFNSEEIYITHVIHQSKNIKNIF